MPDLPVKEELPDLQNEQDTRGVALEKVGISGYEVPFTVTQRDGTGQSVVGKFSIYCSIGSETKGANMSRFSQVASKAITRAAGNGGIGIAILQDMLKACKTKLESDDSYVRIKFPFFVKRQAPISKEESFVKYDCQLVGHDVNGTAQIMAEVAVTYMSLCPCSRGMSIYDHDHELGKGAHNQRSIGKLQVSFEQDENGNIVEPRSFEELVDIIEAQASCPIFNTLKRPDEQYVTERSYDNAKFVEDVARDVALEVQELSGINGWRFVTTHQESIHQYNAVCVKRGGDVYID